MISSASALSSHRGRLRVRLFAGPIGLSRKPRCLFFPYRIINVARGRGTSSPDWHPRAGKTCPLPRDLSGGIFLSPLHHAISRRPSVCPFVPRVLRDTAARPAGRMKGRYRYRTRALSSPATATEAGNKPVAAIKHFSTWILGDEASRVTSLSEKNSSAIGLKKGNRQCRIFRIQSLCFSSSPA